MNSLKVFIFVLTVGFLNSAGAQSAVCPAVRTTSGWLDLFPLPCRKHAECRLMGAQHLCCKGFCTKGVKPQAATIGTDQASTSAPSTSTSTSSTTTTAAPPSSSPRPPRTEAPRPFLQLLPILTTQTTAQRSAPAKAAPIKAAPVKAAPVKTGTDITTDVTYSNTRNTATVYDVQYNSVAGSGTGKTQKLVCPKPGAAPVILFPIPCENNAQCRASSGPDQVCCERRCVRGVPAPRPTSAPKNHQPLLGVIPRECPAAPLGELLFEVQSCKSDADCWPRLCCADGARSYCRTARARLDLVPIANQIDGPVRMFEQYLQCTAPPEYDLFPQPCSSSVDCFPNLCCAEGGKKNCRPPQRSLLALLAGVTQRVGSTLGNLRTLGQANNKN